MKPILVLLIICAAAWAAPQTLPTSPIQDETLHTENKAEDVMLDDDGNFSVRFGSEDGTTLKEEGMIVADESTGTFKVIIKKGHYSYINDDGAPVEFVYDPENPGEITTDP